MASSSNNSSKEELEVEQEEKSKCSNRKELPSESESPLQPTPMEPESKCRTRYRSDWMTHLPVKLQTIPLYMLAIPGTHNSGSFSCEVISGLSSDAPSCVRDLIKLPGFRDCALLSIAQGWSICQSWDILEQLEAGIRYFDLSVSTKKGSDQLHIVHCLYGDEIGYILKDVNFFLDEHPQEVVLLDLNHFYAMETEHHIKLITLLIYELGSKICSKCCLDDLTLEKLWNAGKQVVILYHKHEGSEFDEMWPGSCITSPCPNTDDSEKCIAELSSYHRQVQERGFFVSQGILTASTLSIMENLLIGNMLSLNKRLVPSLLSWIKESPTSCVHPPNIIMTDFVNTWDFIQTVLDLNKWRIPQS